MMYFDKYRGVASGLKFAGYSMASLLFPRILTSLRDAYGFRGCLLVYAALTMNVTALTLLLKEPPWQTNFRNGKAKTSSGQRNNFSWFRPSPLDSAVPNPVACPAAGSINVYGSTESDYSKNCVTPNNVGGNHHICDRSTRSQMSVTHSCSNSSSKYPADNPKNTISLEIWLQSLQCLGKQGSANKVVATVDGSTETRKATIANQATERNEANERAGQEHCRPCSSFGDIRNLLVKPRFYVCVLAVVAIDYTMAVFPATIVDYALDKGASRSHADLSVTYCSPAELFGRIVLPLIGDSKKVSRTALVSASFFLLAVTMLALPATPSFLAYILVSACVTMLLACLVSMKPVVIADYFGIESVAIGWGFAGVTLLPLLLCSPYIIGYFRDAGGSYDGLYQLQAGIHFFVGGLFGLLSVLDKRRRKDWTASLSD
ncbi:monocarboxylate transporter 9-like [Rhipicephalus sanguineus]|uniref:monocarboxylate transporter 9-like n=1 Tax=Rhipicephalus sanguineus TaxID=34632 RepID=UPI0020C4A550|nr:monocarboxylate transporter 9-like [Rhipicephalus sanguineus]